jgi:hypothetical protein
MSSFVQRPATSLAEKVTLSGKAFLLLLNVYDRARRLVDGWDLRYSEYEATKVDRAFSEAAENVNGV